MKARFQSPAPATTTAGAGQPGLLSNAHASGRLAWTCWWLTVVFMAGDLFLQYLNNPSSLLGNSFGTLQQLAFAVVGLLIASRRPENLTGWVISVGTLLSVISGVMLDYSEYGLLTAPGSLPIPLWMAVFGGWLRTIGFVLIFFVVLFLFPDGHLPSPRWRWAARFIVFSLVVSSAGSLFDPDMADIDSKLSAFGNPLSRALPEPVGGVLGGLNLLFLGMTMLVCVAAIVARFRRSRGDEREQMKWLTYSAFFSGAIFVLLMVIAMLNINTGAVGGFLFELLLVPIPIAVGIAILKYRLYDIDVIIRRTLVYGALTAFLAALYFGSVVLLETLLRPIVGENNDVAIVVSTLAIAALFSPLRLGIQRFIDRRFYRRRYNIAHTLETFSATLRDEVDLDTLTGKLVEVVNDTMQPAHVSLWLKPKS